MTDDLGNELLHASMRNVDEAIEELRNTGDIHTAFNVVDDLAVMKIQYRAPRMQTIKAILGNRLNMIDFRRAIKEVENDRGMREPEDDLPVIQTNDRTLREVTDAAINAIEDFNDPPNIFIQNGRIIRIRSDENSAAYIETLKPVGIKHILSLSCNFVRNTADGGVNIAPPDDVCENVLHYDDLPLPTLRAIVETPVLQSNGEMTTEPGYNDDSQLFYKPVNGLVFPETPKKPSKDQTQKSIDRLTKLLEGFPFDSTSSVANYYALLLTPLIRHSFESCVPLAIIDSPQMGTGKSLLCDTISIIMQGSIKAKITAPRTPEEWRKIITSILSRGATVIDLDNVEFDLRSPDLASALTTNVWTDRILGKSEVVSIPQRATWIANGNNIKLGGDMARRCYWIRIDAKTSRPWMRKGFRIKDFMRYVKKNRAAILSCLMIMINYWVSQGSNYPKEFNQIGGFSDWSKTIAGILYACEVPDFLGNLDEMYSQLDEENREWEAFLVEWHKNFQDSISTTELLEAIESEAKSESKDRPITESLPGILRAALGAKNPAHRIGRIFSKNIDKRFGDQGARLTRDGTYKNKTMWSIKFDYVETKIKPEDSVPF